MIRDLSLTLQAILDDPALAASFPELAAAQIAFDRPVETFNPSQTTIDLFLYEIREDMELRSSEPTINRNNGTATIKPPPLRVLCSYLVTAWPAVGTDLALQEHRLLSQALQVLAGMPKIPAAFLKGKLVGQQPTLPMITARMDGMKNPWEFWAAIGNKMRASIMVTVTIAMDVFAPVTTSIVLTEEVRLGERAGPDEEKISLPTRQIFFRIGGRVTGAGNAPVAAATVTLVDTGFSTETGADGNYTLGSVPAGAYTLRVRSGASTQDVSVTIPAPAGSNYNVQL
jgi:Pvc16 N-terminal domain/Carboxypeptidase regulatory-like domain